MHTLPALSMRTPKSTDLLLPPLILNDVDSLSHPPPRTHTDSESINFDFAWRFHLDDVKPSPPPPPPFPPPPPGPIPPARAATCQHCEQGLIEPPLLSSSSSSLSLFLSLFFRVTVYPPRVFSILSSSGLLFIPRESPPTKVAASYVRLPAAMVVSRHVNVNNTFAHLHIIGCRTQVSTMEPGRSTQQPRRPTPTAARNVPQRRSAKPGTGTPTATPVSSRTTKTQRRRRNDGPG
jgi:hypothetical protein